ncbi:GGDEF domain-containing protein [Peptococcaceae bacterium 1198_IL3148]
MKRLQFQKQWVTASAYQLFGLDNLVELKIAWPDNISPDFLTGLPNRQVYDEAISLAVKEAVKQNAAVGIIVFDLDNFKIVNDTYGHLTGDEVLKEFALRAKSVLKSTDFIARYGGEEFVVLTTCYSKAYEIGERVRLATCNKPFVIEDINLNVTCSFGCASYPIDGLTVEDVFNKADNALYKAKEAGRNQGMGG